MAKIKGWKKKVNKKDRIFWENEEKGLICNVERIGNNWYLVIGDYKEQEIINLIETKKEAMDRAIKYMKFHSNDISSHYNTIIKEE